MIWRSGVSGPHVSSTTDSRNSCGVLNRREPPTKVKYKINYKLFSLCDKLSLLQLPISKMICVAKPTIALNRPVARLSLAKARRNAFVVKASEEPTPEVAESTPVVESAKAQVCCD